MNPSNILNSAGDAIVTNSTESVGITYARQTSGEHTGQLSQYTGVPIFAGPVAPLETVEILVQVGFGLSVDSLTVPDGFLVTGVTVGAGGPVLTYDQFVGSRIRPTASYYIRYQNTSTTDAKRLVSLMTVLVYTTPI